MKSSFRFLRVCALAALVAAGMAGNAQAAVITIVPDAVNVPVGGTVSADINIALGAGEVVSSFTFDVLFNDAVLQGRNVSFYSAVFPFGTDIGFVDSVRTGGTWSLSGVIDLACDLPCLTAAQGTGFTLATLVFDAVAPGLSPLAFDFTFGALGDFEGFELPLQFRNSAVCVGTAPCTVPEPVTGTLLLAGLAAAVSARRMTRRA